MIFLLLHLSSILIKVPLPQFCIHYIVPEFQFYATSIFGFCGLSVFRVYKDITLSLSLSVCVNTESTRDIGFRLSGFGDNTGEIETIQQKEKNLLPSRIVQPIRPSFLRRSLAWDSAFFDGPGNLLIFLLTV